MFSCSPLDSFASSLGNVHPPLGGCWFTRGSALERQQGGEQCGQGRRDRRVEGKVLTPNTSDTSQRSRGDTLGPSALGHFRAHPCKHAHAHATASPLHQPNYLPHFLPSLTQGRNVKWEQNKDQGPTSPCSREKKLSGFRVKQLTVLPTGSSHFQRNLKLY